MTIHLPEDLETSIQAAVGLGRFGSADELVAQAVRKFLRQPDSPSPQTDPGLGSIGAMSDAADELDEVVADAYRKRREETWRELEL